MPTVDHVPILVDEPIDPSLVVMVKNRYREHHQRHFAKNRNTGRPNKQQRLESNERGKKKQYESSKTTPTDRN
jgi:hypothetical protein